MRTTNYLTKPAAILLLVVATILGGTAPAMAGYSSVSEAEGAGKGSTIAFLMGTLKGMGFSPAAAAGVISNANAESELDQTTVQENSNKADAEAALKSGKGCEFFSGKSQDTDGYSSGVGLFQLDGSRRTKMVCWIQQQGKPWTDLDAQIHYMMTEDFKSEKDPFTFKSYQRTVEPGGSYCGDASDVPCDQFLTAPYKTGGLEGFKKFTDPAAAAVAWAGIWERPSYDAGTNHMAQRASFAREVLTKYGETAAIPAGTKFTGNETGTAANGGSSSDGGSGKLVDECSLTGMVCDNKWTPGDTIDVKSNKDLSLKDQKALSNAKEYAQATQTTPAEYFSRGIAFIGYGIIFWSMFIFLAGVIDKVNIATQPFLTKWLTLGKMEYEHDPDSRDGSRCGLKRIGISSVIGVLAGVFLASGFLQNYLLRILGYISNKGL